MFKKVLVFAAILFSVAALSPSFATVAHVVKPGHVKAAALTSVLTWVAPTANVDGTALAGAVTYNVYSGVNGVALAKLASGVTVLTYTDGSASLVDGAVACYAITAVVGGVESAQSAQSCKTFPAGVPNAPTGVVVK